MVGIAAEIVADGGRGGQSAVEIACLVHVVQQGVLDEPVDKEVKIGILVRYVVEVQCVLSTVILDALTGQVPEIVDLTVNVGDIHGG